MKISVIIPVYNGERYIAQCIENVLCQTHRDLEIIVIDDGSTDATAAIAARYPSVRLVCQPNGGPSVARNTGIAAATGDYIHFMDVDDLINNEFYERMAAATGEGSNRGIAAPPDIVFAGLIIESQPRLSLTFADRLLLLTLEDKISVTNAGIMGYVCRYLIRRSFVIEKGLAFEPGRLIEDLLFILQALEQSGAVATAPGATYYYIKRGGSLLNTRNREQVRRRKADYSRAKAWRREYYARHGLGPVVKPRTKTIYKLFGIPLWSRVERNDGKTRWYLPGLRILQRRVKG